MNTLVLDGFNEPGDLQERTIRTVIGELHRRGWASRILAPRDMVLGPCMGCLGCWTIRPGMCVQDDDADILCRKIMESDLFLIVSPVTFGGYSSSAKKALDRIICLISPFYAMLGGEVHHKSRYDRTPAMAAIGINHDGCESCRELFGTVLYRNAVNFRTRTAVFDVVEKEVCTGDGLEVRVTGLLDQAFSSVFSDHPVRRISGDQFSQGSAFRPTIGPGEGIDRKLLILTGSPKAQSTSSVIGDELAARFRELGWQTEMMRVLACVRNSEKRGTLAEAVKEADVVALVSPLYVDSLPAPVTEVLESITAQRDKDQKVRNQGLMAVLNCGFPEAFHNYTALAIARQFARESGFTWMGGLALGMGGFIDGKPLAERGKMFRNVKKALDLAATALARGEPVPREAMDLMAIPFIPRWLYLAMGNWGWKRQAKKYGTGKELGAKPYES